MRFETPIAFLFLIFLPLVALGAARLRTLLRFSKTTQLSTSSITFPLPVDREYLRAVMRERSFRVRYRDIILRSLWSAAFVCGVTALARPQYGSSFREVQWSGRDLLLALDISGSMMAIDFSIDGKRVDRLSALKHVVNRFIRERSGDRMALVVFGDEVFTQCPLTLDQDALIEFVNNLQVGMAGKGTAIGDGLAVSLKRIKDIDAESKVIILVTDGKSNSGNLAPLEAAKVAKQLGIKIYTIGIGSNDEAPFPIQTPFGFKTIVRQRMEFDEETLRQIAETTGGMYFNARDTASLEKVYSEISALEERVEKTFQYTSYEEKSAPLILLTILLVVVAETLGATVFLKIP